MHTMPTARMTQITRRTGYAGFMLLLVLLAGCVHNPRERELFDRVSRHLDTRGNFYMVSSAPLTEKLREHFDYKRKVSVKVQKNAAYHDMIIKLAGADKISAYGASSVSGRERYHNRFYAAADPKEKSLLNDIFPAENRELPELTELFPSEVHCAFAAYLRPGAVIEALSRGGKAGNRILNVLPADVTAELLESLEGWYIGGVFFSPAESTGEMFFLTVPDRKKVAYKMLSAINKVNKTPAKFLIRHRDGRTLLYSDSSAEQFFNEAPRNIPELRKRDSAEAAGLPKRGYLRYIYRKNRFMPEFTDRSGVLQRTADGGLLLTENALSSLADGFADLVGRVYMMLPDMQPEVPKQRPRKAGQSAPVPVKSQSVAAEQQFRICRKERVAAIYGALKKFADANGGKFPGKPGFEAFEELLKQKLLSPEQLICPGSRDSAVKAGEKTGIGSCSYAYFVCRSKDIPANFPLVIDLPANHKDRFNVLYANGKVQHFALPKSSSCRRIISFLFTVNKYNETLFRDLMRQAEAFDRKMKKE